MKTILHWMSEVLQNGWIQDSNCNGDVSPQVIQLMEIEGVWKCYMKIEWYWCTSYKKVLTDLQCIFYFAFFASARYFFSLGKEIYD